MVVEADDAFDPSRYQEYAANPRTQQWDALMRTFQRSAPFARPGEWWAQLEEVFDLAWFPQRTEATAATLRGRATP
jgi:L-rhamnose mutarotase